LHDKPRAANQSGALAPRGAARAAFHGHRGRPRERGTTSAGRKAR